MEHNIHKCQECEGFKKTSSIDHLWEPCRQMKAVMTTIHSNDCEEATFVKGSKYSKWHNHIKSDYRHYLTPSLQSLKFCRYSLATRRENWSNLSSHLEGLEGITLCILGWASRNHLQDQLAWQAQNLAALFACPMQFQDVQAWCTLPPLKHCISVQAPSNLTVNCEHTHTPVTVIVEANLQLNFKVLIQSQQDKEANGFSGAKWCLADPCCTKEKTKTMGDPEAMLTLSAHCRLPLHHMPPVQSQAHEWFVVSNHIVPFLVVLWCFWGSSWIIR